MLRGWKRGTAPPRHNLAVGVAAKLNIKPGQRVAVVGRPDGVDLELPDGDTGIESAPANADAVVAFVRSSSELEAGAADAVTAAREDRIAWVAYPKAGQLGTDLNRDSLAAAMRARGVQPVRQIAIDNTWSALRFRPQP